VYIKEKEFGVASSLCFEIGIFLKTLRKYEEATKYFLISSSLNEKLEHKISTITSLKQATECSIKSSNSFSF
jgi:hypothetical protein